MKLYGPKPFEAVTHNHSVPLPEPLPNGQQEEPVPLHMAIHEDLEPEPFVDHQGFDIDHDDQDPFGPEDFAQQVSTCPQERRNNNQRPGPATHGASEWTMCEPGRYSLASCHASKCTDTRIGC